ncbi:MAG: helix-turn-helix transcriptional regulator [Microgenomates group bacterium]
MKQIKRPQTIPFEDLKAEWLKDPEFRKEYEALQPEYQLACQMMDARIAKKMSQKELAKLAGTGQAVISRLEGMNAKPSFSLVQKIATALKTNLTFTFTAN